MWVDPRKALDWEETLALSRQTDRQTDSGVGSMPILRAYGCWDRRSCMTRRGSCQARGHIPDSQSSEPDAPMGSAVTDGCTARAGDGHEAVGCGARRDWRARVLRRAGRAGALNTPPRATAPPPHSLDNLPPPGHLQNPQNAWTHPATTGDTVPCVCSISIGHFGQGGAADLGGLILAGDKVEKVDGKDCTGLALNEVSPHP